MRIFLLAACVAIGLAPLATADAEDAAPAAVVERRLPDSVVLAWASGAVPADAYQVYDVSGPVPRLLDELPGDARSWTTGPGAPSLGVAAVLGGSPSRIVLSAGGPACVEYVPPSSWAIDFPDCLLIGPLDDVRVRVYRSQIADALIGG